MKLTLQFLLFALLSPAAQSETLNIALGERALLPLPKSASEIRVSSRQIVRVQDSGTQLAIVGRKIGQAVLSFSGHSYSIQVISKETKEALAAAAHIIEDKMGLELSVLNDQVLIGGELLRTQDWFDLQSGLQSYVDHWQWRARVNPIIETEFIEQLSKEKLGSLGPGWQIELRPEVTLLSPIPLNAKSPLLMRARRLGFLLTPSIQTSIKVLVTMAEVKKSSFRQLGLGVEDGQTAELLPTFKPPDALSAKLNWLAQRGEARNVTRSELIAKNNTEVEFQSGGEFAVRAGRLKHSEVTWKKHGLQLKIRPTFSGSSIIEIQLNGQLSTPDFSQAVDGVPSLKVTLLQNVVNIPLGRNQLIAKLNVEANGRSESGPTGISEVPILGRLFRSDVDANEDSELLIFLQPTMVNNEN